MLPSRDNQCEKDILTALSTSGVNYAALQPDWQDPGHGDIDIVVNYKHWPLLVETVYEYISSNNLNLVKAYEIEYGVICIVILTPNGTVFLDTAITSHCKKVFGLNLDGVLDKKNATQLIPVICDSDYNIYNLSKKSFKRSNLRKLIKKIKNFPVILRRALQCSIIIRGAFIYIPYIIDTNILKSSAVKSHVSRYLLDVLKNRYGQ